MTSQNSQIAKQFDKQLDQFLRRHHLIQPHESFTLTTLGGGVSSDIWRVDIEDRSICIKRALPSLKVASEWTAPVIRNQFEWEWFNFVAKRFPNVVPRPIAHDSELQMLAMEYLSPIEYPVWKEQLLKGVIDKSFAEQVGKTLGRIHAYSAADKDVSKRFPTDDLFFALRIEPYLLTTAERHPELRNSITKIATTTSRTHFALVHGDVSPKNILVGPCGPVFLDAECAWYGDPAFDVAFCLNHFLLKCTVQTAKIEGLTSSYRNFCRGYFQEVTWEDRHELSARCARLLPALFLARVDGKSPVEYLNDERKKELVRKTASRFIESPTTDLLEIAEYWKSLLSESNFPASSV